MKTKWLLPDDAFEVSLEIEVRSQRLTFGLGAVSFAALIAILSAVEIDDPLRRAVLCLSVSLPLSLCNAMFSWNSISFPASTKTLSRLARIVGFVGSFALFLGVASIFWHFSVFHAVVFVSTSLGAFLAWYLHSAVLKRVARASRLVALEPEESEE